MLFLSLSLIPMLDVVEEEVKSEEERKKGGLKNDC